MALANMSSVIPSVNKELSPLSLNIQKLMQSEDINVGQRKILTAAISKLFYQQRNYAPAWTDSLQVMALMEEIKKSNLEGLNKEDYHYSVLVAAIELLNNPVSESSKNQQLAEIDILLTDAVMLYAFHLINGKVDPNAMDKSWNYNHTELLPETVVSRLTQALYSGKIAEGLQAFKPEFTLYQGLKKGLAYYQNLAETAQPFIVLPANKVLRAGVTHNAVVSLRKRLAQEGYDAGETTTPALYDQPLKKQVIEFQRIHGLDADGILGKGTIKALNVSYGQRANQIRANLERTRWVHNSVKKDFILVNIAGYNLFLIKDNKLVWQTEVMVGKQQNATEVFRASMHYMVFNPTWNVPRSIMRKGMIEKIVADPSYLKKHDYVLLNREGQKVDATKIQWEGLGLDNFPYSVQQQPGTHNSLGQIKFIFPNKYSIYLHDTPSKALFSKTQRAFSSGCVRVKNPFKLAELLLDDANKWSPKKIKNLVHSKKTTRVNLDNKMEVMLMYWTAEAIDTQRIKFNPDIYQLDTELITKLIKPLQA